MKKHVIKDFKHAKRIPRIAKFLKAKAQSDCGEHFFSFENDLGSGKFTGINFECGIDILYIKSVFSLDVTFEFDMGRRHPVLFQFTKKVRLL